MIRAMELWLHAFSFPQRVAELARQAEEWGFTGLLVADSQNLNADIWVELALAGAITSRLRVGPGVTNPITRHPAVTASAAATLQAETGGRAVLGLGRGDSAVTQIGRRRPAVPEFERALEDVQGYLRGEEVLRDGTASAIRWLVDSKHPKVPLHVAATGPRTIAAGARQADGVDLAVGAELERLRWAIAIAREAAPRELSLGAFINIGVDPDREAARELVRGNVAIFAGFAVEGAPAPPAEHLADEFIDRFAVAGPAGEVRDRLAAMGGAGIDRLIVVPGSLDADPAAAQESNRRFAGDVLPALRP
jgi:5,10-methylenetetrahydromethanopterin reductase